jgi:hypothetical protein
VVKQVAFEHLRARRYVAVRPAREPEHLDALGQQLLGEQVSVLTGDPGDERSGHAAKPTGALWTVARMWPAGLVVVFLAAAAVLMLEILAARMLAPYVGVSLNTYTGIIGVVLAGIAAGTWSFGQLVDRYDPRLLLG